MPPEDKKDAAQQDQGSKKLPIKSVIILAAIMVLEAVGFFLVMSITDPEKADAVETEVAAEQKEELSEEMLLRAKVPNRRTGRLYLYDIEVSVICSKENGPMVQEITSRNEARIRDALYTIIAKADPEFLDEPDRQTLKRQIEAALEDIYGEGMIKEVLIPDLTPYRGDY